MPLWMDKIFYVWLIKLLECEWYVLIIVNFSEELRNTNYHFKSNQLLVWGWCLYFNSVCYLIISPCISGVAVPYIGPAILI